MASQNEVFLLAWNLLQVKNTLSRECNVTISNNNFAFNYRHILAVLHFNENVRRPKKLAKDGSTYVNVTYPKYKNGGEVVRELAVAATYSM